MTPAESAVSHDEPDLMRRVAGSTVSLAGRRLVVTALSGLSVAFVARGLGPSDYGQLAAAIATFTLLLGLSDFGFSLTMSRELAKREHERPELLRAAFELQSAWALLLGVVMVALAFATGLGGAHGQALLVLTPALVISGLVSARSVFAVTYTMQRLVTIDLAATAGQVVLMIVAAQVGLGPTGVAAAVALGYFVNTVLAARLGARMLRGGASGRASRRLLLRQVLPVGLMGFMSQVYLTIDVVILGWLVTGPRLGDYAAASRMLTILQGTAAAAIGAALPALSVAAGDSQALSRISARIWHWLAAVALPCFVGAALFAPLITTIALGGAFTHATIYLRILTIAGFVGVASAFLGHILVARSVLRPLMIQNALAIAVNVGGNLALVPRYGVVASAWLTVLTEAIVCVGALITLRRLVDFRPWLAVTWRPVTALACAAGVGLALSDWTAIAIPAFALTYAVASVLLRGWPEELKPGARRRIAVVGGPDA